jgi:RNA polymerase sigma factor (sigma-70 family)
VSAAQAAVRTHGKAGSWNGAKPRDGEADRSRTLTPLLEDEIALERIRSMMLALAWRWYRLRPDDAEDVVQSAFVTFLEIRHRYPSGEDHVRILVGVFRKKCLEFLRRSVSDRRRLLKYCATPEAAAENPWIRPGYPASAPSAVEVISRSEDDHGIVAAIGELTPASNRIASLIVDDGMGRGELIEHFGVNPNTLDTRLRACRRELCERLVARGVDLPRVAVAAGV